MRIVKQFVRAGVGTRFPFYEGTQDEILALLRSKGFCCPLGLYDSTETNRAGEQALTCDYRPMPGPVAFSIAVYARNEDTVLRANALK